MATPTLIMIPSAYKAEKVYSVLPINGDGDLTFNRNDAGTRVNKNGLIEQVATDVPRLDYPINFNLLSYSEDFSEIWWNWTDIISIKNKYTSPSGKLTATKLQRTSTTYNYLGKGISKDPQQLNMTISIFVKQGEGDFFAIRGQGDYPNRIDAIYQFSTNELNTSVGGNNFTVINSSVEEHINGWVRLSISFNTDNFGSFGTFFSPRSTEGLIDWGDTSSSSFVYIWGAQVEEHSYVTPYIPTPRGGCPSLLLEPASTNLAGYSEDFGQAWNIVSSTVNTNQTTSPRGDLTADKFIATATNQPRVERSFTIPATNTTYTFSVFVKKISTPYVAIGLFNGSTNIGTIFNLDTKSVVSSDSESSSIKELSNGWFRISMTQTVLSTDTFNYWKILNTNGSNAFVGVIGDETFIWGAQLEEKPFATSYIPTPTNSPESRGVDSASKDGLSSYISSTAGVLYAEFAGLTNKLDGFFKVLTLNVGTASGANRILLGFSSTNTIYASVVGQFIASYTPTDATDFHKVAVKYEDNNSKLFVNGVQVGSTETTQTIPSGLSRLGFDSGGGSSRFHVKTKDVRVYNNALTDLELQELTTI
jgi:hypothetical protein